MTLNQQRLKFLSLIDENLQSSSPDFAPEIKAQTEFAHNSKLSFYQQKLKEADANLLLEIVNTSRMDEQTQKTFRTFIAHNELALTRERLAGWLDHHQVVWMKEQAQQ